MKNIDIDSLFDLVSEESDEFAQTKQVDRDMLEFIKDRRAGAQKIITQAARKAGVARLTAKHFRAKIPLYNEAEKLVKADKSLKVFKSKYMSVIAKLRKTPRNDMKFQELTGQLEVLGEILIKSKNM